MEKKKLMKWISNLISGILIVLLIGIASVVVMTKVSGGEPQIFGYQIKTVLSGSMEPRIQTGSLIAVKKAVDKTNFAVGDVITFQADEDILITHRITEVVKSGESVLYRTKGDNNNAEDMEPVLSDNVVAEYADITVPYLGYFINFSQSKNGALLLLIPGFILLLYSGFIVWRAISEIEVIQKKVVDVVGEDGGNTPS